MILDTKDIAILRELQQNAKASVKEIAAKVHLSTTPVHERIKRMEQNGVIKQYATLVNHNKVNKGLMVICYVSLKQHDKKEGAKFIKSILSFILPNEKLYLFPKLCLKMNKIYRFCAFAVLFLFASFFRILRF